jgi:hypothetical protein
MKNASRDGRDREEKKNKNETPICSYHQNPRESSIVADCLLEPSGLLPWPAYRTYSLQASSSPMPMHGRHTEAKQEKPSLNSSMYFFLKQDQMVKIHM